MKWSLIITAIRIGWAKYKRLRDERGKRISQEHEEAATEHEQERAEYRRGRSERKQRGTGI